MADEEFMFGDLFATVRVQDLPASREVVAVERQENGAWRVCGSAIANADGIAELGIEGSKTSRVYAFAIDHWGEPFTPNRTVAYGDIIRPSVFLGWLYRVTAPGALPDEEPVWWNSTPGMPRPVGTAMAQAEMYFQPIAHGPVDIEWEDKQEGDPHWDRVVALLHFDDNVIDESARLWQKIGDSSFGGGVFGSGLLLTRPNSNSNGLYSNGVVLDSDFTIECFVNSSSTVDEQCIVSCYKGSGSTGYTWEVLLEKTTGILHFFHHSGTSGSYILRSSNKITDGAVHHIAVTREGSMMRLFIDGNLHNSRVEFREYTAEAPLCIGYQHGGGGRYPYKGMIDELRITSGVARYTENFTPPTEPFPNFK